MTKREQLLMLLYDYEWHSTAELAAINHRFSAVIYDLRKEGYVIDGERMTNGTYRWRLQS